MAYKLQLPNSATMHPVFHVAQLCRACGVIEPSLHIPPKLNEDMELAMEPAEVLGVRPCHNVLPSANEVLIQWQGLPAFDATWELVASIQQEFKSFSLEDKVKLLAAGNVTTPVHFTYTRCKKKQGY